jgi:6-phosphogluconate dehydrogenase (decarboxylating)
LVDFDTVAKLTSFGCVIAVWLLHVVQSACVRAVVKIVLVV